MADADAARRRLILDAFDRALDQPEATRLAGVRAAHPDDSALADAVAALLAADAAPTILPSTLDGAAELIPPERVGVYRLVTRIGRGGMGEVWLGERADGLFDHRVAIKLMRPSLVSPELESFFDRERRLLARMRHPFIARLFDGGVTADGIGWFAMDLVDGVPLDLWASTPPAGADLRAAVAARVRMAIAIGDAVQHAHASLIVHADLKPQNILVEEGSEPRLVDFGIAHLTAAADDPEIDRAYPRTPAYASPERLAGAAPSIADDVFALGVLLGGLLTGVWPRSAHDHAAPSDVVPPPLARVLRGDLDAIVARARDPDRGRRYRSAEAMAADLRAWLDRRPVAARDGGWRYVARRFARRNRVAVGAAVAALVALVATTVVVTALYLRAEAARREAEQRFADVRGLARYMMVDFHDALEPLAGASRLRATTAQVGRSYLERLSRTHTDDPDLLKELAVGYGRVGHTMAVTATNGTTGMEEGDRSLMRAQTLLTRLVADHPARDDVRVELARVLTWRSSVLAYARSDLAGAHRLLDRAVALDDGVLARSPGDVDAGYGRWLAVIGRLDVLSLDERWPSIVAAADDQLGRARMLPTTTAYAALRPLLLAATDNAAGDALSYLDRPRDALPRFRRAYATLEAALARGTGDVRVRTRMVAYAYQLSGTYDLIGDKVAALAWADRGVAQVRELLRFERSPTVAGMANLIVLQHATLLVARGRRDEAVAEAQASVAERKRSALAEPTSDDARSSYLFALRPLTEILDLASRPIDACATARTADEGWRVLYRGRTMPARQASDAKRIADRVARCAA